MKRCLGWHALRGQFWSFDIIFAIVIFSFSITVIVVTWYGINNQLAIASGGGASLLQLQASVLAQRIFEPGYPGNWQGVVNVTNTITWSNVSVGLAGSTLNSTLSSSKVYALAAMSNYDYGATKQMLGISYDYFIIIKGQTINITIGSNPATNNAVTIAVQDRNGVMNGIPVKVSTYLWTGTNLGTA